MVVVGAAVVVGAIMKLLKPANIVAIDFSVFSIVLRSFDSPAGAALGTDGVVAGALV